MPFSDGWFEAQLTGPGAEGNELGHLGSGGFLLYGLFSCSAMAKGLLDHCEKLDEQEQAECARQFVIDVRSLETVGEFTRIIIRAKWLE